jgi:hypothetical protein
MLTAVSSTSSTMALQDKLARCTRQLGDWEACPSGKTPEGKKIIENLRAQISTIENTLTTQTRTQPGLSTLGGLVDTFA